MNFVQQGPLPNASTTAPRGVVTNGAQTFGGPKTYANPVTIADQGGAHGLRFANAGDGLRFGDAAVGPRLYAGVFGGETALRYEGGPVVLLSAQGFCMGGVNSHFASGGVQAFSQSYLADLTQSQPAHPVTVSSAKGGSAGVVAKVGTTSAAPHGDAELLRVGHSLAGSGGSDGVAVFKLFADGRFDIASGNNKELQFGGVATIYVHNDGGLAVRGNQPNSPTGLAALCFGNQGVLTEGTVDLVQFRNGLPSSGVVVASVTAGGNLVLNNGGAFKTNVTDGNYALAQGSWGIWRNSGGAAMNFSLQNGNTHLQLLSTVNLFNHVPVYSTEGFAQGYGDSAAAPGNAVVNFNAGRSAIANGATTVQVSTTKLGVNDRVLITWEGNHGAARDWVTYAAGSFTVNLNVAATANTPFTWCIIKKGN